jgi:hypothetical protein
VKVIKNSKLMNLIIVSIFIMINVLNLFNISTNVSAQNPPVAGSFSLVTDKVNDEIGTTIVSNQKVSTVVQFKITIENFDSTSWQAEVTMTKESNIYNNKFIICAINDIKSCKGSDSLTYTSVLPSKPQNAQSKVTFTLYVWVDSTNQANNPLPPENTILPISITAVRKDINQNVIETHSIDIYVKFNEYEPYISLTQKYRLVLVPDDNLPKDQVIKYYFYCDPITIYNNGKSSDIIDLVVNAPEDWMIYIVQTLKSTGALVGEYWKTSISLTAGSDTSTSIYQYSVCFTPKRTGTEITIKATSEGNPDEYFKETFQITLAYDIFSVSDEPTLHGSQNYIFTGHNTNRGMITRFEIYVFKTEEEQQGTTLTISYDNVGTGYRPLPKLTAFFISGNERQSTTYIDFTDTTVANYKIVDLYVDPDLERAEGEIIPSIVTSSMTRHINGKDEQTDGHRIFLDTRITNVKKTYILAVDALDPRYLDIKENGNYIMPNLRQIRDDSASFSKAYDFLPSVTDVNHLGTLTGTTREQNGIYMVAAQYTGWDSNANAPIVRASTNDMVLAPTMFDTVKSSDSRMKTAVIVGKNWMSGLFPDRSVDIKVDGFNYPFYIPDPWGYTLGSNPTNPTGTDVPSGNICPHYKAVFNAQPGAFVNDSWVIEATKRVIDNEDPDIIYILMPTMDDAGHAFGSAYPNPDAASYPSDSDWDTQIRTINPLACPKAMRNEIKGTDSQIESFVDFLKGVSMHDYNYFNDNGKTYHSFYSQSIYDPRPNRYEKAITVITADHGMSLTHELHADLKQVLANNGYYDGGQSYDWFFSEGPFCYIFGTDLNKKEEMKQVLEDYTFANGVKPVWKVIIPSKDNAPIDEYTGQELQFYNELLNSFAGDKTHNKIPDIIIFMNSDDGKDISTSGKSLVGPGQGFLYDNILYSDVLRGGTNAIGYKADYLNYFNNPYVKDNLVMDIPGQHGSWSEQRIPLIFHGPGIVKKYSENIQVTNLDVVPTIMDINRDWSISRLAKGKILDISTNWDLTNKNSYSNTFTPSSASIDMMDKKWTINLNKKVIGTAIGIDESLNPASTSEYSEIIIATTTDGIYAINSKDMRLDDDNKDFFKGGTVWWSLTMHEIQPKGLATDGKYVFATISGGNIVALDIFGTYDGNQGNYNSGGNAGGSGGSRSGSGESLNAPPINNQKYQTSQLVSSSLSSTSYNQKSSRGTGPGEGYGLGNPCGKGSNSGPVLDSTNADIIWISSGCNGGTFSPPILFGDKLFTTNSDGNLYIFSAESGSLLQYLAVESPIITSPPIIVGNNIYIPTISNNQNEIIRIQEKITGEFSIPKPGGITFTVPIWSYTWDKTKDVVYIVPQEHGNINTNLMFFNNNIVYGTDNGYIDAVNLLDSSKSWYYNIGSSISSTPTIRGQYIYFTADDKKLHKIPYNDPDGDGVISDSELPDGWNDQNDLPTTGDIIRTNLLITRDYSYSDDTSIFFGSNDKKLYGIHDYGDYGMALYVTTNDKVTSSPMLFKDGLYFGTADGQFYKYAPKATYIGSTNNNQRGSSTNIDIIKNPPPTTTFTFTNPKEEVDTFHVSGSIKLFPDWNLIIEPNQFTLNPGISRNINVTISPPLYTPVESESEISLSIYDNESLIDSYYYSVKIINHNSKLIFNNIESDDIPLIYPISGGDQIINLNVENAALILSGNINISGLTENGGYPLNPFVDIGMDGSIEWSHLGIFYGTEKSPDLTQSIDNYILTHQNSNSQISIPILFHSDSEGILRINDINIDIGAKRANLEITKIMAPQSYLKNSLSSIEVEVYNSGIWPSNETNITLSVNNSIQERTIVTSLAPGEIRTISLNWTPLQSGFNTVNVMLDDSNVVPEKTKIDNYFSRNVFVADYVFSNLNITNNVQFTNQDIILNNLYVSPNYNARFINCTLVINPYGNIYVDNAATLILDNSKLFGLQNVSSEIFGLFNSSNSEIYINKTSIYKEIILSNSKISFNGDIYIYPNSNAEIINSVFQVSDNLTILNDSQVNISLSSVQVNNNLTIDGSNLLLNASLISIGKKTECVDCNMNFINSNINMYSSLVMNNTINANTSFFMNNTYLLVSWNISINNYSLNILNSLIDGSSSIKIFNSSNIHLINSGMSSKNDITIPETTTLLLNNSIIKGNISEYNSISILNSNIVFKDGGGTDNSLFFNLPTNARILNAHFGLKGMKSESNGEINDAFPSNWKGTSNNIEISSNGLSLKNNEYSSDANTIGLWHLNENFGTIINNEENASNYCTIKNGDNTIRISGLFSSGIHLNGANHQYIDCGNNPIYNLTGQITLEAWIKPESTGEYEPIIMKDNAYVLQFAPGASGYLRGGVYIDGAWRLIDDDTIHISTAAWTHVAFTYDGSQMRLYVNGKLIKQQYQSGNIAVNENPLFIGRNPRYNQWWFSGKIDEIRISSIPRQEFNSNKYNQIPIELQPDLNSNGIWNFNEGSGNIAYDSLSLNNGTLSSMNLVPGRYNNGLEFDPTNKTYIQLPLNPAFNITTNLTLDAWIYPHSRSEYSSILMKDNAYVLQFAPGPEGYLRGGIFIGGSWYLLDDTTTNISANDWTHVAFTYNGTEMVLYVDGIPVARTQQSGLISTNNNPVYIGRNPRGAEYWFDGIIDEVRISNIARTEFNLFYPTYLDDYTVGLYHLDSVKNFITPDAGERLNGALMNFYSSPSWTTGYFGSALQFNGSLKQYVKIDNDPVLSPSGTILLQAWICPASTGEYEPVIMKDDAYVLQFAPGGNGYLRGGVYINGAWRVIDDISTKLEKDIWYHVAFYYNGAEMSLFVNNTKIMSQQQSGNIAQNSNPIYIGRNPRYQGWWYSGIIDDVGISSGPFMNYTQAIGQFYTEQKTFSTGNVVSVTPLINVLGNPTSISIEVTNDGINWVRVFNNTKYNFTTNGNLLQGRLIIIANNDMAPFVTSFVLKYNLTNNYPTNITNAIGWESSIIWSTSGPYDSSTNITTENSPIKMAIQMYLLENWNKDYVNIPIFIHSDTSGILEITDISIIYTIQQQYGPVS